MRIFQWLKVPCTGLVIYFGAIHPMSPAALAADEADDTHNKPASSAPKSCGNLFIDQLNLKGLVREAKAQQMIEEVERQMQESRMGEFSTQVANRIWALIPGALLKNRTKMIFREMPAEPGETLLADAKEFFKFLPEARQKEPEILVVFVPWRFILNGKASPFVRRLFMATSSRLFRGQLQEVVMRQNNKFVRFYEFDKWVGTPPAIDAQSKISFEFVIHLDPPPN